MADVGTFLQQGATTAISAPAVPWRASAVLRRWRAPFICTLLIAADVTSLVLAGGSISAISGQWAGPRAVLLTTAVLFVTLGYALGLYTLPGPSSIARFRLRTIASLGAVGLEFLISDRSGALLPVICAAGEAALLVLLGHYIETALRAVLIRAGLWSAATFVVNCNEKGQEISRLLTAHPEIGLLPVGFITNPGQHDNPIDTGAGQILSFLRAGFSAVDDRTVIFTSRDEIARFVCREGRRAALPRLLLVEDAADPGTIGLRPRLLGDIIGFEADCGRSRAGGEIVKRAIDLFLALPLALLALPVIGVLAGLIVLVSPGTPFYRQERVGRFGRPIRILKLRTMYADAESRLEAHLAQDPGARAEWARFFKLKHDPRVLSLFGNFVRRSSLDELPQLWNVIRGDMSLVGPRPFPIYHVTAFDPEFQALRASVKPGLTGLWQISVRSNGDIGVQKAHDSFYINNWSLWMDFYILLQTLPAVLHGGGAR